MTDPDNTPEINTDPYANEPDRIITVDPTDKRDTKGHDIKISAWWKNSHSRSSMSFTRNEMQAVVSQAADIFGIYPAHERGRQLPGDDGTRVYRDRWNSAAPARQLTDEDLAALRSRTDAYYYSFETTGVQVIDDLLHAIAWAGKYAHHTDTWPEEVWMDSYGPLRKDENWIALIQSLAADAADEIRKALL